MPSSARRTQRSRRTQRTQRTRRKKSRTRRKKSTRRRGGSLQKFYVKKLTVPEDIKSYINDFVPDVLTDDTIRGAVVDYLAGGDDKAAIERKYGKISNWDVSNVTDMSRMFEGATSFNQPLNNWKVSRVEDMRAMFDGAKNFNQPLNEWDVRKVTDMSAMFYEAFKFNQPLNKWDVSRVTDMSFMFSRATDFNQPLNDWGNKMRNDVITENVFSIATSFNQPLNEWNVSNATDMSFMFMGATSFDMRNAPQKRRRYRQSCSVS